MAVHDVTLRDWWRVMSREILAGLALGCVLAALGTIRILAWQYLGLKDYGLHYALVAAAVSCSLIGVVCSAVWRARCCRLCCGD